jgi:hypothetical protein
MAHPADVARGRNIVARWCNLAERRLEYLTELFETGRWRRFHTELEFLENIQEAKTAVATWRDLLSRVLHGARASLAVALLSVVVSGTVGIALGVIAGYFRGWAEIMIMRAVDVMLSIPAILLAIITVAVLGPGFFNLVLVLGFTRWPRYCRVAYAQTLSVAGRLDVEPPLGSLVLNEAQQSMRVVGQRPGAVRGQRHFQSPECGLDRHRGVELLEIEPAPMHRRSGPERAHPAGAARVETIHGRVADSRTPYTAHGPAHRRVDRPPRRGYSGHIPATAVGA